jgi:hypothetical protein
LSPAACSKPEFQQAFLREIANEFAGQFPRASSLRSPAMQFAVPMAPCETAETAPHNEDSSRALHAEAGVAIRTRQAKSNGGQRASAAHELQALAAAALQQRRQLLQQALRRRHAEQRVSRVRLQTKRALGAAAKDGAGGGGAEHERHAVSRAQL